MYAKFIGNSSFYKDQLTYNKIYMVLGITDRLFLICDDKMRLSYYCRNNFMKIKKKLNKTFLINWLKAYKFDDFSMERVSNIFKAIEENDEKILLKEFDL